jgi:hypothetical protein
MLQVLLYMITDFTSDNTALISIPVTPNIFFPFGYEVFVVLSMESFNAMQFGGSPTFRRNISPPSVLLHINPSERN